MFLISFLLLVVRHLLLETMHLFLVAMPFVRCFLLLFECVYIYNDSLSRTSFLHSFTSTGCRMTPAKFFSTTSAQLTQALP